MKNLRNPSQPTADKKPKTSHLACQGSFELKIHKIENLGVLSSKELLHIEAAIFHGGKMLTSSVTSSPFSKETIDEINLNLKCNIEIWRIPKGSRVGVTLYQGQTPLGWINVNLIDWKGDFQNGTQSFNLW